MSDEDEASPWARKPKKSDEETKPNPLGSLFDDDNNPIDEIVNASDEETTWDWEKNETDKDDNSGDEIAKESDEETSPRQEKGNSGDDNGNESDEETSPPEENGNSGDENGNETDEEDPWDFEIKKNEFNEEENPGDEMTNVSDEEPDPWNWSWRKNGGGDQGNPGEEEKESEEDKNPNDKDKKSDEEANEQGNESEEGHYFYCSSDMANQETNRWDWNGNQATQADFLVQCTPSPRRDSVNDMSIDDDVIPASDDDSMGEGEVEIPARDKRKRSRNSTPSTNSRLSRNRKYTEHLGKHAPYSPPRTLFPSEDSDDESVQEIPFDPPVGKLDTVNLVSSDEDEKISNSLFDMENQKSHPRSRSIANEETKKNLDVEPQSLRAPPARAETSTPLMHRRPFSNIDNLDITAIEKTQSHLNETIATCVGENSDEDSVDDVQSSLASLSILDGAPSKPIKNGRNKLSDIVENADSDSDTSMGSVSTVVEKVKPRRRIVNIPSSDEESFKEVGTIELDDSVDSVNSLFDVEAIDDDDSEEEEDEDYSPGKKAAAKSKRDEPRKVSPPASTRGMSKEYLKYEFKNSVQKTINELARIIEEMPVPDDDNQVPERLKYLKVDLFKHQLYGLKWLFWRENQYPGGGILADEMGLGKTVMIIALVLKSKQEKKKQKDRVEEEWNSQEKSKHKLVPSQSTLVVCPAGMLAQWETEINTKTRNLSVVVFHGPKRKTSAAVLAQNDFVITTYATLGSEIPKDVTSRSPLSRIHWERVVLDEGHIVRNNKTIAAHGVSTLHANHRWVVTGTPVHNSARDMFSLVSFLRLHPFSDVKVWEFWIGFKSMSKDQSTRLHTIGKSLLLRRTKDEVNGNDGERKIPPKTVVNVEVELTLDERMIYDHLFTYAEEKFRHFLKDKELRDQELQNVAHGYVAGARRARPGSGNDVKFSHMFSLILRLRQASVLPYLIHTMLDEEDAESDLDTSDLDGNIISLRNPCFKELFKSAKIQQLLSDVNKLKAVAEDEDRNMDKVIIISQWVKLLEIIAIHMMREGYTVVTITGKQTLEERSRAMDQLNSKRSRPEVMCLSLGAGGVGLNLVGANHVFFMDLHWNPQLELQAQDRVHRYGQTKNVTITRYVSKDTIDERVVTLQGQKLELAEGILTNTKKTSGGGLSIAQMRTLFDL